MKEKDEDRKLLGEFAFYSLKKEGTFDTFTAFFEKFYKEYGCVSFYASYMKNVFPKKLTPEARKWFCEIFSEEVEDEDEEVDYKFGIKFFEQFSKECIGPRNVFRRDILPYLSDKAKAFYAPDTQAVEEEKPEQPKEVFYKVGDRFEHRRGIYKLCSLGHNMVALVKVEKYGGNEIGNIYQQDNGDYSVIDREHITKEEFSRLTSENPELFTLIEET